MPGEYDPTNPETVLRETLANLSALLTDACDLMDTHGVMRHASSDLKFWWQERRKFLAEKREQERQAQLRETNRQTALSKLTEDERRALRIYEH